MWHNSGAQSAWSVVPFFVAWKRLARTRFDLMTNRWKKSI